MPREPKNRLGNDAAADLWQHTLCHIPTVFGRLVYLASLRDPVTGKYEHHGLALMFGREESSKALKKSHVRAFREWLLFNLEEQKADLDLFRSSVLKEKPDAVRFWSTAKNYRSFVPSAATAPERKLFASNLEAMLGLLKNEYGVFVADRGE